MGPYNGWERVNWFARDGDDISLEATRTWNRSGPWKSALKKNVRRFATIVGFWQFRGSLVCRLRARGPVAGSTHYRRREFHWRAASGWPILPMTGGG